MGQIMDFDSTDKRLQSQDDTFYIQSDKEFFYCAGKLVKYIFIKQMNGPNRIKFKITWGDHHDILYRSAGNFANDQGIRKNIRKLISKVPEALSLEDEHFNRLLAAVMAYECVSPEEIHEDAYLVGGARALGAGNLKWKGNTEPQNTANSDLQISE